MNSAPRIRVYAYTWAALMALLAATFFLAHVKMGGAWNPVAALAIAAAKAILVALFFMHLKRSSALTVLFALVALFALAILFTLSGADYATRLMHAAPWLPPRAY